MLVCWSLESRLLSSVRSCLSIGLGQFPPSFMMNALLAKAEPIRDTGNVSGITYFKMGEKCCTAASGSEEWENMRETSLQTPKTLEKQREEVLQVPEQRFPCSLWYRPWWARLFPWIPEDHSGSDTHLEPTASPILEQMGVPQSCSPWTSHTGAGSWQELQSVEKRPHWCTFSHGIWEPMRDPHCSSPFLRDSSMLWKEHMEEQVCEELPPMGMTRIGEGHEGL